MLPENIPIEIRKYDRYCPLELATLTGVAEAIAEFGFRTSKDSKAGQYLDMLKRGELDVFGVPYEQEGDLGIICSIAREAVSIATRHGSYALCTANLLGGAFAAKLIYVAKDYKAGEIENPLFWPGPYHLRIYGKGDRDEAPEILDRKLKSACVGVPVSRITIGTVANEWYRMAAKDGSFYYIVEKNALADWARARARPNSLDSYHVGIGTFTEDNKEWMEVAVMLPDGKPTEDEKQKAELKLVRDSIEVILKYQVTHFTRSFGDPILIRGKAG